jgi:hypothetical protein
MMWWLGLRHDTALCGKDCPDAGIRGGALGATISPGSQVFDGVNHASADLPIFRTSAVEPVFLERAVGEAQELRGLRRAQKPWRKAGE